MEFENIFDKRKSRTKSFLERAVRKFSRGFDIRALGEINRSLKLAPTAIGALSLRAKIQIHLKRWRPALEDLNVLIALENSRPKDVFGAGRLKMLADSHWLRANLRLMMGDCSQGWRDLMSAFELSPRHMSQYGEGRESLRGANRAGPGARLDPHSLFPDKKLIARLDVVIRRQPRLAAAWAWRGVLKRRILDYSGAVADLSVAWSLGLRSAMILTWRGEARMQTADTKGMGDLERALKNPCAAWNFAWCGRSKMHFYRSPEALKYFSRAIALDPENGWYYAWRAEAKRLLRRPAGMLEDFDRALSLDLHGHEGFVRSWRGLARAQLGKHKAALEDFNGAIRKMPDYALARIGRAQTFRALGMMSKWFSDFENASQMDSKYSHSHSVRSKEELEAFLKDIEQVIDSAPKQDKAWRWRGLFLYYLGRLPESLLVLNRAVVLNPKDPWSYAWRGQVHLRLGDLNLALADFNRSLNLDASNAVVLGLRAKLFLELGKLRPSLNDFNKSLSVDSRHAWVFSSRGRLRLLIGDAAGGAVDLERGINLDRGDADSYADLAAAYRALGKPALARRASARAFGFDRTRAKRRLEVWAGHARRLK